MSMSIKNVIRITTGHSTARAQCTLKHFICHSRIIEFNRPVQLNCLDSKAFILRCFLEMASKVTLSKPRPRHPFFWTWLLLVIVGIAGSGRNGLLVSALSPEQRLLVDEAVESYMTRNHVPGMGLTIVEQNGGNVFSIGYGRSRLEPDSLATSQTLFLVASITKSIVSVLVVKTLSEKYPDLGESVLDMPVSHLAPEFNLTLNDRFRTEFISFRDLLSHRTCAGSPSVNKMFGMVRTTEDYNYRLRYLPQECPFRSRFDYSNSLYSLASSLIAHIAGVSFEQLVAGLFAQLGMTDSRLVDLDGGHEQLARMSHAYYRRDNVTLQFNTTHLRKGAVGAAAGGGLSTARDMGEYIKFHLNKGRVGNNQLVSEEALSWMSKMASVPYNFYAADELVGQTGIYGYGLGLALGVYEGSPRLMHTGYSTPYESLLSLYPAQGFGLFCSINGPSQTGLQSGQMSQEQLHHFIYDIVHRNLTHVPDFNGKSVDKPLREPWRAINGRHEQKELSSGRRRRRVGRVEAEELVGVYGCPTEGDAAIILESEAQTQTLSVNFGWYGLGVLVRVADSDTLFSVEWLSPVDESYYANGGGPSRFWLDFSVADEFHLIEGDPADDGGSIAFYRDRLIDTWPVIPWDPNSCGPPAMPHYSL